MPFSAIPRLTTALVVVLSLCALARAQDSVPRAEGPEGPIADPLQTRAERDGFVSTSTHADVEAFLEALMTTDEAGRFLLTTFGESGEGRALRAVAVGPPGRECKAARLGTEELGALLRRGGKLRVLVLANIHGGEVEGKEVAQILLREFALGHHEELLERIAPVFVPLYNADGNDRIDPAHRVSQNGPDEGVGIRENAAGLDLNRDLMKAASPETRSLLRLLNAVDPQVVVDLHTTNGSDHAYHLTYAGPLCPQTEPRLADFVRRELLPEIRRAVLDRHLFRTFEYGNWSPRRPESGWTTFDHRPRFLTNYVGLRNRISILSEAYSYRPFEVRIRATRAFVLEALRAAARRADGIREICAAADRSACGGDSEDGSSRRRFTRGARLVEDGDVEILLAPVEAVDIEGRGTRRVVRPGVVRRMMPLRTRFEARASTPLPVAWALLDAPETVLRTLEGHGLAIRRLAEDGAFDVEALEIESVEIAARPYQDVRTLDVEGRIVASRRRLPAGTAVVLADQPLSRLAAQLLEPLADDGLTHWGFFDLGEGAQRPEHPVLRLTSPAGFSTLPLRP